MAIPLETISFIVPIRAIKQKYPGGWEQCLKDHEELINGRVWFDDELFRDGAMNMWDINALEAKWMGLGFLATDYCIMSTVANESPVEWLDFNPHSLEVEYKF